MDILVMGSTFRCPKLVSGDKGKQGPAGPKGAAGAKGDEGTVALGISGGVHEDYPLVTTHITMENHHFEWENSL